MPKKIFAFWFAINLLMLPLSTQAVPISSASGSRGSYVNSNASSLVNQMVEQNFPDPNLLFGPAFAQLLNNTGAQGNETYQGISQFWHNDLLGGFFASINQKISNWLNHFFSGYLPDIISSLSGVMKSFFLNPNLMQIAANANNTDDLSFLLRQLVNVIYGIALDLLFLLFVLAIWQYWTKASWQGNISAMTAIGRLICAIGIILAWPVIYSFEIELSNEMISAIFANGADQLHLLDMAMANMFSVGMYSGLLGTLMKNQIFAIGTAHLSGFLWVVSLLALCILAIILIYELVYLIALKTMQTALLTAQYVFAPVFLIFFATPSTEKIATGYIRTFAETSVWSFIWIGLLKILVILMYANFNPWGKIITAIGILQLMMRVPQFLGRFKVSSASAFVNPAFLTDRLQKGAAVYAGQIGSYTNQFVSAFTGVFRGASASQTASAASNNMSANFSFAGAGGRALPLPNGDRHKSGYMDAQSQKNKPVNINDAQTPVIGKLPLPDLPIGKNIDTRKSINRHAAFHVPRRRNLPRQKHIFNRHNENGGAGNIFDLPTKEQSSYGVPASAAALLDNSSLCGPDLSGSNTLSHSHSNFYPSRFPNFSSYWEVKRLPGITFSQFDLSPSRLNLALNKRTTAGSRLFSVGLAAAQLAYGSGSALVGRQQFTLPSLIRNSSRLHDNTGSGNKLNIDKTDGDFKINSGHILTGDHVDSNSKSTLFNAHKISQKRQSSESAIHPNNRYNHGNRNEQRNQYINQGKTALYYSSPVYPGWQRPYHLNSNNSLPTNTERSSTFYAGINYPDGPCFRSYYS